MFDLRNSWVSSLVISTVGENYEFIIFHKKFVDSQRLISADLPVRVDFLVSIVIIVKWFDIFNICTTVEYFWKSTQIE